MIVSHKYKYIFLMTSKTAGTSIEISLSRFAGKDDVIPPLATADEEYRKSLEFSSHNYILPRVNTPGNILKRLCGKRWPKQKRFFNHMPATEVRACVEQDVWNSYFKF